MLRDVTYRYQPPQNFTALSAADSLRDSNPFSAANLKGKQLWFITAPANAPISRLPAFSPVDVAEGNPVMEIKGRSFCLNEDTEALDGSVKIMFPDSKGVYRAVGQSIEKAFRMVESLPKRRKISKDQIPEAQPVRLQPEGLRMRYKPFGAVGDAEDEVMGGCQ
ncbi:DNA-directed RNA polymerase I subunit RPA34.5-domain-containing protein [Sphaerosporella brunnea]|uniref:DNA-directed RNA polymerase I subunit RPA34.5-domain-containing protein n=1 Tax=Sphaerosporella brunnea TaxID=1250544 RepID=A0A5J5EX32_9PEZI|nr:DNA-directed RNA polymerase I subunit RPA34.5-domain-containing protein [Sphaerosporella brunnea]